MAFAATYTDPAARQLPRERVIAWLAVAVLHLLIGWLLISGLSVSLPGKLSDGLKLFTAAPAPPPPPPVRYQPPTSHRARAKDKPSPPNLRSKATDVVAPTPQIVLPPPVPIVTAPQPYIGQQASTGAAAVAGPGTGAGGDGNGYGGGGDGDGDGDGRPLRLIKGRLKASDLPRELWSDQVTRVVGVSFVVSEKGRVTSCTVTRSSGQPLLDTITCRLIQERLRYRPELDRTGRPVAVTIPGTQTWYPFLRTGERREPGDEIDDEQ